MKCPKCGKEIEEGSKFCGMCGNETTDEFEFNKQAPKKKKIFILIVISLVAVIVTVGLICIGAFDKDKTEVEKVQQGLEDYFDVKRQISEITSAYETDQGYIETNKKNDSIIAVGEYAKKLYENKKIKDYEITEEESVWIQFQSGVEYLYIPLVEGMDSSTVSTYQPCLTMYSSELQELSEISVDGAATQVESKLEDYSFKNNYDNETISLELLKNIGTSEVVIWHGHGGYNERIHSVLMTSLKLDEEEFLLDPIYYIQKIGYTDDYLTGRIVCSDSGYVLVTHKFFEKYLDNISTSVIYLGACDTGKDDVLANTFISKGAKSVVANTEEIPTKYNLKMISNVFDELVNVSDNKYQDIKTALDKAKTSNADLYDSTDCVSDVRIWGDNNIRLSDAQVQVKYKAEDLICKSIPEIVDIMGGDFEVEYGGEKLVYFTSPTIIMYNDATLPGFAFYIDEAVSDYHNGENIKENIKQGKYDRCSLLAITDDAKLNDSINAKMKYNELTQSLGAFDCSGIAGAGAYCYDADTLGEKTIYLFYADESLLSSYSGGDIKKDWLREHNPTLSAIIVYPKSEDKQNTENEEKGSNEDWKQLYIDYVNSMNEAYEDIYIAYIDGDNIPELFVVGKYHVAGASLCWIDNGEVKFQVCAQNFGFKERSEKCYAYTMQMGVSMLTEYTLSNGKLTEKEIAFCSENNGAYTWNGTDVSKDDFWSKHQDYISNYTTPNYTDYTKREDFAIVIQSY